MREIKFRGWNEATKTMVDLKKITPLALNMDTDGLFIPFFEGVYLMQFTGLHDKRGEPIFEGDVLELNKNEHFRVGWYQDECFFGLFDIKDECPFNLIREDCYMWEIIGNIYENPELIGE